MLSFEINRLQIQTKTLIIVPYNYKSDAPRQYMEKKKERKEENEDNVIILRRWGGETWT